MKTPRDLAVRVVGLASLLFVLPGCGTWLAGTKEPSTQVENQKYFYSPHSVHEEPNPWVRDRIDRDEKQ
jgi:hypothetical protein